MALNLNYFYGSEAEQFSFYRIPKTLFTDAVYKSVSVEAKVLYGTVWPCQRATAGLTITVACTSISQWRTQWRK